MSTIPNPTVKLPCGCSKSVSDTKTQRLTHIRLCGTHAIAGWNLAAAQATTQEPVHEGAAR